MTDLDRLWLALITSDPGPESEDLLFVMRKIPRLRSFAWQYFVSNYPSLEDLSKVILGVPELRQDAWRIFAERNPYPALLFVILREVGELRDLCGEMLLKENLPTSELCAVMQSCSGPIGKRAWEILQTRPLSRQELRKVVLHCPIARAEAAEILLERFPSEEECRFVLLWSPSSSSRAEDLLRTMTTMVRRATTENAMWQLGKR